MKNGTALDSIIFVLGRKFEPKGGRPSVANVSHSERTYKEGLGYAPDNPVLHWKKGEPLAREHRDKPLQCVL